MSMFNNAWKRFIAFERYSYDELVIDYWGRLINRWKLSYMYNKTYAHMRLRNFAQKNRLLADVQSLYPLYYNSVKRNQIYFHYTNNCSLYPVDWHDGYEIFYTTLKSGLNHKSTIIQIQLQKGQHKNKHGVQYHTVCNPIEYAIPRDAHFCRNIKPIKNSKRALSTMEIADSRRHKFSPA